MTHTRSFFLRLVAAGIIEYSVKEPQDNHVIGKTKQKKSRAQASVVIRHGMCKDKNDHAYTDERLWAGIKLK